MYFFCYGKKRANKVVIRRKRVWNKKRGIQTGQNIPPYLAGLSRSLPMQLSRYTSHTSLPRLGQREFKATVNVVLCRADDRVQR